MWKSEPSNYTFMARKGSLQVLPTSLLCLRYRSHTVSHRCDDNSPRTAAKRGWSSSCQLVSVGGTCFTDGVFLSVLRSGACIHRANSDSTAMGSLCSYYRSSEGLSDMEKCQSALLNHVLKRNFCRATVGCSYKGWTIVISCYYYYCVPIRVLSFRLQRGGLDLSGLLVFLKGKMEQYGFWLELIV